METQEWAVYVDASFSRLDVDGDGFVVLDELIKQMPRDYFRGWVGLGVWAVLGLCCVCAGDGAVLYLCWGWGCAVSVLVPLRPQTAPDPPVISTLPTHT